VGYWFNELGSVMQFDGINVEGVLEGKYYSKVGEAYCWYTLRG